MRVKRNNIGLYGRREDVRRRKALLLKVIGPMIGTFTCITNGEYHIVASLLLLLVQPASAAAASLLLAFSSVFSSEQIFDMYLIKVKARKQR